MRTLRTALAKCESFDAERYDSGVRQCIEEEVILLFNWKSASFTFDEGHGDQGTFDKEQLECNVELDPQAVAMEAARRMDEWEGISRQIASEREIFVTGSMGIAVYPSDGTDLDSLLKNADTAMTSFPIPAST